MFREYILRSVHSGFGFVYYRQMPEPIVELRRLAPPVDGLFYNKSNDCICKLKSVNNTSLRTHFTKIVRMLFVYFYISLLLQMTF